MKTTETAGRSSRIGASPGPVGARRRDSRARRVARRAAIAGVGLVAATAALFPIATDAGAATVPNIYYCSRETGHCRQQNGNYVSYVPSACHWVWTYYFSDNNFHGCSYWF